MEIDRKDDLSEEKAQSAPQKPEERGLGLLMALTWVLLHSFLCVPLTFCLIAMSLEKKAKARTK